jgi:hypothetical protein
MLRYSKSVVISATLALVVITLDIGGQEQQPLGLVMAKTIDVYDKILAIEPNSTLALSGKENALSHLQDTKRP